MPRCSKRPAVWLTESINVLARPLAVSCLQQADNNPVEGTLESGEPPRFGHTTP
jgi:hypothetical protein